MPERPGRERRGATEISEYPICAQPATPRSSSYRAPALAIGFISV